MEIIANLLSRPKNFIAALISGITAFISIIGTISASAVALIQMHTADNTNTLSKNVSVAILTQQSIDKGFVDRVNTLEEAV